MPTSFPDWFLRAARLSRLFAFVLALAGQVSAVALTEASRPSQSPRAILNASLVLCRGSNHSGKDGAPPVHHHLPGPAMQAASHHLVQLAALLDEVEALPAPPALLAVWTGLPETRGPPGRKNAAFYPTGPPTRLI